MDNFDRNANLIILIIFDMDQIKIIGARTHNLKNISLNIPRNKIVVVTGVSGSGKSSLVFDTIYSESQRKYLENLSTYSKQFNCLVGNPDVDSIEGLSPSIALKQRSYNHNSRSTIGTISEINSYLRLLFSKLGIPICPKHKTILKSYNIREITETVLKFEENTRVSILAPLNINEENVKDTIINLQKQGYLKIRINKKITELTEIEQLEKNLVSENIELIVDRLKINKTNTNRLSSSIETALNLGQGNIIIDNHSNSKEFFFSNFIKCRICKYTIKQINLGLFSSNNIIGACKTCSGKGQIKLFNDAAIINKELSITNGAICICNNDLLIKIKHLSQKYNFNIQSPFKLLPNKIQEIIIFGETNYEDNTYFAGIIDYLEKLYQDMEFKGITNSLDKYRTTKECPECGGSKLCEEARNIKICSNKESLEQGLSINEVESLKISECLIWIEKLKFDTVNDQEIFNRITLPIINKLNLLKESGLGYLSLDKKINEISRGEAQRVLLAGHICSDLTGITYIFDEPSAGLHKKDIFYLIKILRRLCEMGNSIVIVEHDENVILNSDWIIELGPGAGLNGGNIIFQGTIKSMIEDPKSITGYFLRDDQFINKNINKRINKETNWLKININNETTKIKIPIGLITCLTGTSGSGKSNLVDRILIPYIAKNINGDDNNVTDSDENIKIVGLNHINNLIYIDQNPIGNTPNSNLAIYSGIFTIIRNLFSQTAEARVRGYKNSRFSLNVKGGRCEECKGKGIQKTEMHFLSDIELKCAICNGKQYNNETLEISYRGLNISEILNLTVEEAVNEFNNIPNIYRKLQEMISVGLSYVRLGQNLDTLSGGEIQRLKIATELAKKNDKNNLYVIDEPTLGLHFQDIKLLLQIFYKLKDQENTLLIIEHNSNIIKNSDWVIDIEANRDNIIGSSIISQGVPE